MAVGLQSACCWSTLLLVPRARQLRNTPVFGRWATVLCVRECTAVLRRGTKVADVVGCKAARRWSMKHNCEAVPCRKQPCPPSQVVSALVLQYQSLAESSCAAHAAVQHRLQASTGRHACAQCMSHTTGQHRPPRMCTVHVTYKSPTRHS
jgi:hypothetical protein